MNRSAIVAVVCLVLIAASAAWIFLRPESAADRSRRNAGWRKCAVCGYEWYKDRGELIREAKNSPDGYGLNKCPQCGAWRGLATIECPNPQCGKRFTLITIVEDADGNLSFPKQRVCPYCGYKLGTEVPGEDGGAAETE
jgi:ribosomal protein L32